MKAQSLPGPAVHTALCMALVVALPATAISQDPPPPPGGFPVIQVLDQPVFWSDGYETRMDLYHPGFVPPVTGWPGVLIHHGSGGNRKLGDIIAAGNYLAAAGYVVYAVDHRGAGQTPALNPGWPTPTTQERVLWDCAEAHAEAQAQLPGLVDGTRLAATGFSGGGRNSYQAAAWSGKPMPAIGGVVATHPQMLAVAPEIAPLDHAETAAPGGVLCSDYIIQGRPSTDPIMVELAAENYPAFAALIPTPFNIQMMAELQASKVPILAMVACQDFKIGNNVSLDAFAQLPANMPRRLFLSTGGHSTVKNHHERSVQQDLRRRWFDHYLKGIPNGANLEPYAEVAVQPPSNAQHTQLSTIWEHRTTRAWPPPVTPTRFFLRAGNTLRPNAPPAIEVGPTLLHRTNGHDVITYEAQGGGLSPAALMATVPMVSTTYETPALQEAREYMGRGRVDLWVSDTTGVFQLSARLAHVDPAGAETWIAMGTGGVRGTAPGLYQLRIDLDDVAHRIPAGHRLRLTIQNLSDHDAPGSRRVRYVPYFTDTDSLLLQEPGAASSIALPLRPYQTNMLPRLASASAAAGITHTMSLRGGTARAGMLYATIFGASGEAPGAFLGGGIHVPLNVDSWTLAGMSAFNSPFLPLTAGVLNATGQATPGFTVPPALAAGLAGIRFTFTSLVIGAAGVESAGGPVSLVIRP